MTAQVDMLTETVVFAPPQRTSNPAGAIQDVVFPIAGELRARKVVTRSRARSTGKYPSWKMGRMVQWESTPELNAFRILDSDSTVIRFSEQPCKILYVQDGIDRSHVPDILVEYSDRKELWEVKVESEALTPEIAARTALMDGLTAWGYRYKVALAAELASQPRLNNAVHLRRFGGVRAVRPVEREYVRLVLKRSGHLFWGDACRGIYGLRGREILCRLALEGVISLDLTAAWTETTRFFPGKGSL